MKILQWFGGSSFPEIVSRGGGERGAEILPEQEPLPLHCGGSSRRQPQRSQEHKEDDDRRRIIALRAHFERCSDTRSFSDDISGKDFVEYALAAEVRIIRRRARLTNTFSNVSS